MLVHPQFDPVALHLGPVSIHWYGLAYLAGFAAFLLLARWRIRQPSLVPQAWVAQDLDDLLFYGVLGVVLGGRLGFVLFYKPEYFLANPAEIIKVWTGGMAFHGGLLGVIVALAVYGWKRRRSFFDVTDLVAPCVGLSFGLVRIANFVNGELWGREADASLPWAMVFPQAPTQVPRHPSQIYQAIGEGMVLFGLLWLYARRPRLTGQISGLFLFLYGLQRFVIEFFREPDAYLGLQALGLSRGQWLCLPMIAAGLLIWIWASRRNRQA
ncbi:prolipoprotein diacylglyceryl transferase [Paucibacter sp. APW11]|uniref:Phosphatidylglycerol--prolipoprotein diacylglyceryl transferase n=1 Tax=Roseateles aquae TaxID=3077235 RepID=A0ABU3P903_9BURK|nr:prolipoprotein diacylglyceryl transferase [Paucibacter sp. APW11]MDT8999054.1 prolipoprotein diacylglyceryl transferase [Paucibacter sp. APW11]